MWLYENGMLKGWRKNLRIIFLEIYKGNNEFNNFYQSLAYVINTNDGKIIADTTSILSRWEQFYKN